ncbi:MAG TPA: hypothetical protein H9694_10560 [Firmicutes bacterium]|nr:hypothetical protein [Bacillota bacterium]
METKINLHFGDTIIPGMLNDSTAAQELLKRLPCIIHASRCEFDVCGVLNPPLPRVKEEMVTGWHNGDISFDGTYFTILFGREEESASYGLYSNLGRVSCPLARLEALHGSYDIRMEKAE